MELEAARRRPRTGRTRLRAAGRTRTRLYSAEGGRVRAVQPQPEQPELGCTFQHQSMLYSGRTNSQKQAELVAVSYSSEG
jgi:hypothetical protein